MIPEDLVPPDCPWPIVLGIDPGTRVLGYGAVIDAANGPRLLACGVLRAADKQDVATRLGILLEDLETLLARARPRVLSIESAFSARNVQSALRIGEARGMVIAAAARRGLQVAQYAPSAAKRAVLGNGHGSKEQVASMVATHLGTGTLDVPLDATDALALALTHLFHSKRVTAR